MMRQTALHFAIVAILVGSTATAFAQDESISPEQTKFFETKIRPVLARECYSCHSTRSQVKGGLWLDTKSGTRDGGDSGAGVVPGDLDESMVWLAIINVMVLITRSQDIFFIGSAERTCRISFSRVTHIALGTHILGDWIEACRKALSKIRLMKP